MGPGRGCWQDGYGILTFRTFRRRDLETACIDLATQEERHQTG
jgi:hypothetical protein